MPRYFWSRFDQGWRGHPSVRIKDRLMAQIVMRTLLNRSVNISSLATNLVIACTLAYLEYPII